ncbi:MAG: hypothetical protein Q9162_002416 [Coniocarpon cinnabarinum]
MPLKLEDLPTELLEHIVSTLDIPPPSVSQSAQEPNLPDLRTSITPLKNLALVSSSWNRLVTPLIFRYLRLSVLELQGLAVLSQEHLDSQEEQRKAKQLERVHTWQSRQWTDPRTKKTFYASMKALSSEGVILERYDKSELSLSYADLSETDEHYVSMMANHVQDQLSQSLTTRVSSETLALERFLAKRAEGCYSLLVYSSSGYEKNFDTAGHHVNERAKMWSLTNRYINPSRLVLIAPPELLARLAHCFTNVTDLWSFHIPFQRIELYQHADTPSLSCSPSSSNSLMPATQTDQRKQNYTDAEIDNNGYGLLHSRYWSSFEYDEGSSLNIYGTYHYFEKRPPSIINLTSMQIESLGSWLRTFTYTSIFPHHAHFIHVLEAIEGFKALTHLKLKLAPDATSLLLADHETIGRGNLAIRECWNELERCYGSACGRLLSTAGERRLPILERFTCLDLQNEWVRDVMEGLRWRLLPEWRVDSEDEMGSWIPVEPVCGFRNWDCESEKGKERAEGDAAAVGGIRGEGSGIQTDAATLPTTPSAVYTPSMFGAYDP